MFKLMDKKIIAIVANYFCLTGPIERLIKEYEEVSTANDLLLICIFFHSQVNE